MVTVAIASLNTRNFTELAIRTAKHLAGCPLRIVVGDCGSTDGSLRMLRRLHPKMIDDIEVAPTGRYHGEWLDHWVRSLDDEFVVFVDSDVQFLRAGWLVRLLEQQARDDAAIVAVEWIEAHPFFVLPNETTRVHLAARPAPWVQLIHRPTIAALGASFNYRSEPSADVPEGILAYDVSGWVAQQATERGHVVSVMSPEYQQYFVHYRGRSWTTSSTRGRLQHLAVIARLARVRVVRH